MKTQHKDPAPGDSLAAAENLACEMCGRWGAFRLGDRALCQDCYSECGSCCAEFGNENLVDLSEDHADPAHEKLGGDGQRPTA